MWPGCRLAEPAAHIQSGSKLQPTFKHILLSLHPRIHQPDEKCRLPQDKHLRFLYPCPVTVSPGGKKEKASRYILCPLFAVLLPGIIQNISQDIRSRLDFIYSPLTCPAITQPSSTLPCMAAAA
jgi:hypothetical protein